MFFLIILVWKVKYALTNFLDKEKLAHHQVMKKIDEKLRIINNSLKDAISYIKKNRDKTIKSESKNNKDIKKVAC